MIAFKEFNLSNGLQVIVHTDHNSPIVCLNTLYKVGSRNEHPNKTGFAHLFEHLMFGGSVNVPEFDTPLQAVGGDNNAFTNTDITNYYTTVPANNLETAFWLESDRMLSLSFDPNVLDIQQKVVIEEYKQRYLNQPYGDSWLKIRPLAYLVHPYQWSTIGKSIDHVADATMDDVKTFFHKYYHPANAILVLAGDISFLKAKELTEKWYGSIPARPIPIDSIPHEPTQLEEKLAMVSGDVPQDAVYKVFHMGGRTSNDYYATDLASDLLGNGKSSWLYQKLVKENPVFTQIGSGVMGTCDPGLIQIHGKVHPKVEVERANELLDKSLIEFSNSIVTEKNLNRVKNMSVSGIVFGEVEVLNRAMHLAFATFLGNSDLVNQELSYIQGVKTLEVEATAKAILTKQNSSTLIYKKLNNK